MDLLSRLFDPKMLNIIKEVQGKEYLQIREVSRSAGTPPSTTFRIFQKLESLGLLRKEKVGKISIYRVLKNTDLYLLIEKLVPKESPLQIFCSKMNLPEVEEILLMNQSETMANLLIIGDIKPVAVQELADTIKKDFNYSIRLLVLSRAQYENLENLNMKPIHKEVLFKKK